MSIGKGIQLSTGFDLNAKAPLDNREWFKTIRERDSLPDINLYNGLKCYVDETKKNYQYIDGAWLDRGNGDSGGNTTISNASDIPITDANDNFEATNVEGALDELANRIDTSGGGSGDSSEFEIEVNGELTNDYTLSVNTNEVADAYKSVYDNLYSQFQMMFSQMQKIIDTQQKRIDDLEARVFALENEVGESDNDKPVEIKVKYIIDYKNEPLVDYKGGKIDNYGEVVPVKGIVDYRGRFLTDYNGEAILDYEKVTVDTKAYIVDFNGNVLVDYNGEPISDYKKVTVDTKTYIADYDGNILVDYNGVPITDYREIVIDGKNYIVDYRSNALVDYNGDTIKELDKTIKDYSGNTLEDYNKNPVINYGNVIYLVDYQQNNVVDYNNNNIYIKEDVI